MMLVMLVISLFLALLLCSLMFPSIWVPVTGDDYLDAHEAGLSVISSRKQLIPYRVFSAMLRRVPGTVFQGIQFARVDRLFAWRSSS